MALQQLTIQESDLALVLSKLVDKNLYSRWSTQTATAQNGFTGVVNNNYQGEASQGNLIVGIPRVKRFNTFTRTLGGESNGDFVNDDDVASNKRRVRNETLSLTLNQIYEPIVEVPVAQSGFLQFSAIQTIAYNISNEYIEKVDTYTAKRIYDAAMAFGATLSTPYSNVVKTANDANAALAANAGMLAFNTAFEKMTNLPENDYDKTTPLHGRAALAKNKFISNLRDSGTFIVGSEYAYTTFVQGVESYGVPYGLGDERVKNNNYLGSYLGINVFLLLDSFMPEPGEAGEIYAIVTHFLATTRAFTPTYTKYIDSPDFMGKLYQYWNAFGVLCHKPWIPQIITSNDWAEVEGEQGE